MATDTLTDNELIAEFMGFEKRAQGTWDNNEYAYTMKFPDVYNKLMIPSEMLFATSWDWLMPVVEKIAQHVYESYPDHNGYKEVVAHDRAYPRTFGMIDSEGRWMVRINRMPLEQEDTLIKATYNAVVEFIKFYNQQTKP